jgi:Tol biopolymer transport system component
MRKLLIAMLLSVPVAVGAATTATASPPHFEATSTLGDIVFFTSSEQLVPGDTDNKVDVYERSFEPGVGVSGEYVTREISTGPIGGNDAVDALFQASSEDGSRVVFQTAEPLVAADTDRKSDVYVREVGAGSPELVSVGESDQNGAAVASFAGATPDGKEVFFVTTETLSTSDQDEETDIYERDLETGETHLVSLPANGCPGCDSDAFPSFSGVSAEGQRVFFATTGRLSPADADSAIDIYARDLPNGPTELVSQGSGPCLPACGNDSADATVFGGSSNDGSKVFFETTEPLVESDVDNANDVYRRSGGVTTLISPGTADKPANLARENVTFRPAISADGSKVFFQTTEPLLADSDEANDVYEYSGGGIQQVTPNGCTGGGCGAGFDAITPDGSTLVFSSEEQLVAADTDSAQDLYVVSTSGGSPVLASVGEATCSPGCGNSDLYPAVFDRISSDGSELLFNTEEQLSTADGDSDSDMFARDLASSETEMVTPPENCPILTGCDAGFAGSSSDALHVLFLTPERLDPEADKDSEVDLYERDRESGVTRLVSRANGSVIGPAVPVLTGTNPVSPGTSTSPALLGRSDPGTTIKLYAGAGCQGAVLQTLTPVTAAQLEGTGIVVSVAAGSTNVFSAAATDSEGVDSACSGPVTYSQQETSSPPSGEGGGDGSGGGTATGSGSTGGTSGGTKPAGGKIKPGIVYVAPLARITFGPAAKTRARRPVFRFFDATGQPDSAFSCKVDKKSWKPCTSPIKLPRLNLGKHVFSVAAVNAVGVAGGAPVRRKFKVVR